MVYVYIIKVLVVYKETFIALYDYVYFKWSHTR
jgi:hypothetical protein